MIDPIISFIVPVYNVEEYLNRCVDSLLEQSLKEIEILLVDDGSPDHSPEICEEYAKKDNRIKVIHKKNGGLSDARNKGMAEAKGKYLCFVDGDDFVEPNMGVFLYQLAVKNHAQIAVCGLVDYYKDGPHNKTESKEEFLLERKEAVLEWLKGDKIPGSMCAKLFEKELFEGLLFPVGLTYEDAYLGAQVLLRADHIAVSRQQLYSYWHRPGSITTGKFSKRVFDVITAYEHTYRVIKESCPEHLPAAKFRVYWAHFVALDRMLYVKDCKNLPEYQKIVGFLKKHWKDICGCEYFQKSRRLAAAALKAGVPCYKVLWRLKEKRQEV